MNQRNRVLLVDDDPEIAWGVGRCLTRSGYTVSVCGDGAEAISLLENQHFDLLITDIQMPRLNGLALIEWAVKHHPEIRIIAITAFGSSSVQQMVLRQGAILYMEKPFDPNTLIDLINPNQPDRRFSGNVANIDLFDYVQLIFVTMQQMVLSIRSCEGEKGTIYIENGTAVHAECGSVDGEPAFFKCLSFNGGTFSSQPWRVPNRISIERKGEFLLMEAARFKDETGVVRHNQEEPDHVSAVSFELDLLADSDNGPTEKEC